ncbi:MAG TPA: hypothetical protein VGD03_12950 [Frankiaceae bacterium]
MDGATGPPPEQSHVAGRTADGAPRAAYVRAYDVARAAGDVEAMTEAALGLAARRSFGTFPGRVPAFLHEAYMLATGLQRGRLAVALARAWVYGGDPARAVEFAEEAVRTAESTGDAALLADALDAQLLVHWGPDDLPERLRTTRRLEDSVAHLTDVGARLSAHLWRLTTALECLDLAGARRQLRALDSLAEESASARVRFFAAARHGLLALLTGDLAAAGRARDAAVTAGTEAGEADTEAIDRTLSAAIARQAGDRSTLAREAALYEAFGTGEAVLSITAQAAVLWLGAGETDRAGALLHQLAGDDLSEIPRDVDWLLTLTSLAEVAAATGATDLAAAAVPLLSPYSGRGVLNAGAAFEGVVDDYLARALLAVGRTAEADHHGALARAAYGRLAATWWSRRVPPAATGPQRPADVVHLHPAGDGLWTVGRHGATHPLPDLRGLQYLRLLLDRPGIDVPALDLSDAVAGHAGVRVADFDSGPVIDRQALAAYRQRVAELDEDLAEADAWGDSLRAERLSGERQALLAQVAEATGLGGRARTTASARERARVAVRKAITATITRIGEVDPALARLLRDTVLTGGSCRYDPDPHRPVHWVLRHSSGRVEPAVGPPP